MLSELISHFFKENKFDLIGDYNNELVNITINGQQVEIV